MEIVALVVALVALLTAFFALRRAGSLQERLDRASGTIIELRGTLNDVQEQLKQQITEIRLSLRQQSGDTIFRPNMTIAEALAVHPKVNDVLASFHLGGCSHCAVSDVDTIEGACQTYGIDQKGLMAALNSIVGGGTAGPVKAPNVRLDF